MSRGNRGMRGGGPPRGGATHPHTHPHPVPPVAPAQPPPAATSNNG